MTRREALKKAIEAAVTEYAGDGQYALGTVASKCYREIDAVVARADYFIAQRPEGYPSPDDPRPWPALEHARKVAEREFWL